MTNAVFRLRSRVSTALLGLVLLVPVAPSQEELAFYDAPVVVLSGTRKFDELLDLDDDGSMDAIGWWHSYSWGKVDVVGYRNDGAGTLNSVWVFQLGYSGPYYQLEVKTEVGDFNGDGRDDFVIALNEDVRLYSASQGWWLPQLHASMTMGATVKNLAVADFNEDGLDDLAVVAGGVLHIYINQGQGQSLLLRSTATLATGGDWVIGVSEVDGDGRPDLYAATGDNLALYPVLNGVLGVPQGIVHNIARPMPGAGDLDGDGDEDIVVFGEGEYAVLRRTGPGAFTAEPVQQGGQSWYAGPRTMHMDDIDGDGDLDAMCCGGGGGGQTFINDDPSLFTVSWNDGTGAFTPAAEFAGIGSSHLAGSADLDGDGDVDLVGGRCIYYAPAPLTAHPTPGVGAFKAAERGIVDLDGDGDPDLECGAGSFIANAGDGSFAPSAPVLPLPPSGAAYQGKGFAGDFDGDGDTDLVVRLLSGGTFQEMRLLVNNGGAGFSDAGPAATPGIDFNLTAPGEVDYPDTSTAADADADGDLDLLVRSYDLPTQTRLWWNNGGVFSQGPLFGEFITHVADFNGDGIPDLLGRKGVVTIHPGLGGSAFGPAFTVPLIVSNTFDRIAVADLDKDGDLDIAGVTTHNPPAVLPAIAWNDGQGGFSSELLVGSVTYGSTRTVLAVDVNGDGWDDLVVPHCVYADNASWIYLKKPAAHGFESPSQQMLRPIAVLDLDGDGDPDLVGSQDGVSSMLYRNRYVHGADAGVRRQYGFGTPGSGQTAPTLGVTGPFRVGETVRFLLTGAAPETVSVFAFGTASTVLADTPLQGLTTYVVPVAWGLLPVGGTATEPGSGNWTLPVWIPNSLEGTTFFHQVFLVDPSGPSGVTATNGLEIGYGASF